MFKKMVGHPDAEVYFRQLDEEMSAGALPSYEADVQGLEIRTSRDLSGVASARYDL